MITFSNSVRLFQIIFLLLFNNFGKNICRVYTEGAWKAQTNQCIWGKPLSCLVLYDFWTRMAIACFRGVDLSCYRVSQPRIEALQDLPPKIYLVWKHRYCRSLRCRIWLSVHKQLLQDICTFLRRNSKSLSWCAFAAGDQAATCRNWAIGKTTGISLTGTLAQHSDLNRSVSDRLISRQLNMLHRQMFCSLIACSSDRNVW